MVGCFHPKHVSTKACCLTLDAMRIRKIIHSHTLCHIVRSVTKAKSLLVQLLNKSKDDSNVDNILKKRMKNKKQQLVHGSVRFDIDHAYYGLTANKHSEVSDTQVCAGYLKWYEEELSDSCPCNEDDENEHEIDQLAEKFIASFHEKFRLEKQDSYRRYHEMLARSM